MEDKITQRKEQLLGQFDVCCHVLWKTFLEKMGLYTHVATHNTNAKTKLLAVIEDDGQPARSYPNCRVSPS